MTNAETESAPAATVLEPEVFLKLWRDISETGRNVDDVKSTHKSKVEGAKGLGVNIKALKMVVKLRKMEPRDTANFLRDVILYMNWLGINPFGQGDMFENVSLTSLPEAVARTQQTWEVGWAGYDAGKSGSPLSANPHKPGTEFHQAWAREWVNGNMDRGGVPPTTEISPKTDGKPAEEDEGDGDGP